MKFKFLQGCRVGSFTVLLWVFGWQSCVGREMEVVEERGALGRASYTRRDEIELVVCFCSALLGISWLAALFVYEDKDFISCGAAERWSARGDRLRAD